MHKILSDLVKYCEKNEGASVTIKECVESQLNLVGKTIEDLDTRLENIESHELFEIVSELPSEPKDNTIYLIPSQNGDGNNVLTEWVHINGTWEQFGEFNANVDLSEYAKKEDIATINGKSIINGGNITIEGGGGATAPMVSVTYAELKALRDNGELIAGMQYRITDFVTTTAQENTRSAGHQFDVIVTADNENTLNEVARACLHEGDTYFSEAGAKLEAWQIWYSLDNDTQRFAWADNTGVQVLKLQVNEYLRSQLNKQFRYLSDSDIPNVIEFSWWDTPRNGTDGYVHYSARNVKLLADDWLGLAYPVGTDVMSHPELCEPTLYLNATPTEIRFDNPEFPVDSPTSQYITNGKGVIYRMIDEWNNDCPYDFKNIQFKRNLIFENGYAEYSEDGEETWVYTFAGQSYHINNDEWSNMLDGSLESPYCHMSDEDTSTFHDNIIKPYIMTYNGSDINTECGIRYLNDIVLLGYWYKVGSTNEDDMPYYNAYCCYSNSFGNNCYSNTLEHNSYCNSFGNNCSSNILGNYCYCNSFGNTCHNNSFGNNCHNNKFGDQCISNSFGNNGAFNTFGTNCYNNIFKDNGERNSIQFAHNVEYCLLEDNVSNMVIWIDEHPNDYTNMQFLHIYRGVSNDEIYPPHDVNYEICYAKKSNGDIVQFVLAELKSS